MSPKLFSMLKVNCKTALRRNKTVYIEANGECEVYAGDIKSDAEVEILNPDLHIATFGPTLR